MTDWIVETLVSTSLLMVLVLAVRRPTAKWFGARIAYALWLLPAIRMVLPPMPGHHMLLKPFLSAASAAHTTVQFGLGSADTIPDPLVLPPDVQQAFDAGPLPSGPDWASLLIAVWLVGAALWFGWQMLRYRLFVASALRGATHLSRTAGVDVFASDGVEGPIASGVINRRIFLPRDFIQRYSSSERRQALLHEGAHHDRKDLLANVVAIGVVALHWWNPMAHLAYRCFRADQELACDATVLADAAPEQLHAYGSALVKSTVGRTPAAACAFNRTDEIKRRLRMIKRGRLGFGRRMAGIVMAAGAVAGGLMATASGSNAAVRIEPQAHRSLAPIAPAPPPEVSPAAMPAPPEPGWAEPAAPIATMPTAPAAPGPAPSMRAYAAEDEDFREEIRQAREEARQAGEEARQAAQEARIEREAARAEAAAEMRHQVAASIGQARAEMVANCTARGFNVSSHERDWNKLALCDKAGFNAQVVRAMEQARAELAQSHDLHREPSAQAIDALDTAIARMRAHGVS